MADNSLPIAADVERNVLGSCLGSPKIFLEYAAILRPEHFAVTFHAQVFTAMSSVSEAGGEIDLLSIHHELTAHGASNAMAQFSALTDGAVYHFQPSHAEILVDRFRRRQLIRACERATDEASDPTEKTADVYAHLEDAMLAVRSDGATAGKGIGAVAIETMNELAVARKQAGKLLGLTTTLAALDQITTGIRPGEFWVIGGRPGHGKTALAAQIGFKNATNDVPVDVFSLEMKDRQMFCRALAPESGVDNYKIRDPRYANDTEWRDLNDAAARLAATPLWIDDSDSLHISELIARATLGVRRRKTRLVIVDYLQIVDGPGEDEKQKVGGIVNRLRAFAKREQIGVVALSQLLKTRDLNEKPTVGSLRETGRIEDAAHVVLLMFQPVDDQYKRTGEDEVIVGKNREGMTGSIPVVMDKQTLAFHERTQ